MRVVWTIVVVQAGLAEDHGDSIPSGDIIGTGNPVNANVRRVDQRVRLVVSIRPARDKRQEMGVSIKVVPGNRAGIDRKKLGLEIIMLGRDAIGRGRG